jgi:hypothetical protein
MVAAAGGRADALAHWQAAGHAPAAFAISAIVLLAWRLPAARTATSGRHGQRVRAGLLPLPATFVAPMLAQTHPRRVVFFVALVNLQRRRGATAALLPRHAPDGPADQPGETSEGLATAAGLLMARRRAGHAAARALVAGRAVGNAAASPRSFGDLVESMVKRDSISATWATSRPATRRDGAGHPPADVALVAWLLLIVHPRGSLACRPRVKCFSCRAAGRPRAKFLTAVDPAAAAPPLHDQGWLPCSSPVCLRPVIG